MTPIPQGTISNTQSSRPGTSQGTTPVRYIQLIMHQQHGVSITLIIPQSNEEHYCKWSRNIGWRGSSTRLLFLHESDSDIICTGRKLRDVFNDFDDELFKSVLISSPFSVFITQIIFYKCYGLA